MKKMLLTVLFFATAVCATCTELYEGFKSVLESQLTAFCETQVSGVFGYRFYVMDETYGYINAMLVFDKKSYYLYFDNVDDNPFKCSEKTTFKTETPEMILKVLFAPRLDNCEKEFVERYTRI